MCEKLSLLSSDWFCAVSCPENRPVHHALTALTRSRSFKETRSVTMNIFRKKKYFPFKSFVKVELNYVFTINLFNIAENCTEK